MWYCYYKIFSNLCQDFLNKISFNTSKTDHFTHHIHLILLYTSIKRHLDYTSAIKVSFAFTDQQTDLKDEKTAVFALNRLRNSAVYLFSAIILSVYRLFVRQNAPRTLCTGAFLVATLLFKPALSFILLLLPIIFNISFPIQHIIPKHVFCNKI